MVVHGTYMEAWSSIQLKELSRMERTRIHFASVTPQIREVISGMRRNCGIYIYVDLERALSDGYKFYRSVNVVILCSGNNDDFYLSNIFQK